jgi:uncharacterized protein (TIGR02246 family)
MKTHMNDEQAIRDLIATWLSASKAGDSETVLGLMSDDVIFLVCGQPPMRGKEEFAASQAALKDVEMNGTSEIQEVKVLGDWAYVWTHLSVDFRPKGGGGSKKRAGNTLSILRKHDGKWLLVRDANMLAPVS